jgi:hypothetical protein
VKGVLHNIGGGVKVGRGPSLAKQGQKNIGTRIVKRTRLQQLQLHVLFSNSKLSNKTPNQMQQSVVKFIAQSHRRCSTCFRHYYAHNQELFQTANPASGFRINAEVDVFPAMVGLLVGKQCLPTVTAV